MVKLVRPIWALAIFFPIIYAYAGFNEASQDVGKPLVPLNSEYDRTISKLKESLEASPTTDSLSAEIVVYPTSVFTAKTVVLTATRHRPSDEAPGTASQIVVDPKNSYRFESASFVLAAGAWLLALYLLNWGVQVVGEMRATWNSSESDVAGTSTNSKKASPTDSTQKPAATVREVASSRDALAEDILYSRLAATKAQQQASMLVVSGVAMALLGVIVFYYSLAPISEIRSLDAEERMQVALLAAFRPGAALFFIEGVAWFLLRQYRLVSLDFKGFLETTASRTNVLACIQLADKPDDTELRTRLVATLLSKGAGEPLKAGESTVALENERLASVNPLWELAGQLVKKIPDAPPR